MPPFHSTFAQSYYERSELPNLTPLATYLLRLIHLKRTNLCVSADVTTTNELLRIAEDVGEHICVLKTHADIISDFGEKTIRGLNELSLRKKFLVFEDRKFGDIGNTVQLQYTGGPMTIVRWASIINAHLFPGPAIITALSQAAQKAITAHNSSVSTDIRASPATSVATDFDDHEEDWYDRVTSGLDGDEALDNDATARKFSVVSVSTTISMKSESVNLPAHPRPSVSRISSGAGDDNGNSNNGNSNNNHHDDEYDDDDDDNDEAFECGDEPEGLTLLGPPPFYRSLLLLAQMSSANNLFTPEYTAACVQHARENKDFVIGFIAQKSLNERPDDNFITMTPGVQMDASGDSLGQQYQSPTHVIQEAGTDVMIVGRGILGAQDRKRAALSYRKQGWEAYRARLKAARQQRRIGMNE